MPTWGPYANGQVSAGQFTAVPVRSGLFPDVTVTVGGEGGEQTTPKRSIGSIIGDVLLGAAPVVLSGVLVWYFTREPTPAPAPAGKERQAGGNG